MILMLYPNISPIGTERMRSHLRQEKNIYFCKKCIRNFETCEPANECKICNSNDILLLKEAAVKQTKFRIFKNGVNDKMIDFIIKEHKGAKAFDKIYASFRNKLS